ncbi:MAG: hypothetical protein CML16_11130 [Pusillimonas sp.]|nr:hypothetical protein [Pusillimonas sp.]MBC40667.1 hypothetical protein [Pusillimonas sp.]HCP77734.1 hypothetical protein [Pusillimonas sp.]|tara:strand:- start:860 stop:1276 length:417 start_codon:yes stop_codon:yes gene_type:complete
MQKIFITAFFSIALTGCAPATLDGVRQMGPERSTTFTADQNYQHVYRKILRQARACHQTGMITAQMVVQGDLYHDIKSGTVSVALHGGLGVDTYQVIDVVAVDGSKTKVTGHYSLGSVQEQGELLRAWVLQDSTECPA